MTKARTLADNFAADINGITAGTGITGGGTSGTVTITNDMATTIAAKGDLVAGTANDTYAALTVGANDTVLTADSTTATGLKWATPSAGGANWSLLNTGGTALTSAATITVSGISGKDKIMIIVNNASSSSAGQTISVRFNGDSGTNYYGYGAEYYFGSTYAAANFDQYNPGVTQTSIRLGIMSGTASSILNGYCLITGCNSSGVKVFQSLGAASASGSNQQQHAFLGGYYDSSSTISSISLIAGANFDAGTVYVYASA